MLMRMLCFPKPCIPLIDCIRVAFDVLSSNGTSEEEDDVRIGMSLANLQENILPKVGGKRLAETNVKIKYKRQRTTTVDANIVCTSNLPGDAECTSLITEQKKESTNELCRLISLFLEFSKPVELKGSVYKPETTITALSFLCLVFSAYPNARLSYSIFHQVLSWIPWICEQVCRQLSVEHTGK